MVESFRGTLPLLAAAGIAVSERHYEDAVTMRKSTTIIAVICVIALVIIHLSDSLYPINSLDDKSRVFKFKLFGGYISNDIVIVKISGDRWPWDSLKIATLINLLAKEQPRVIGLDFLLINQDDKADILQKTFAAARNIVLPFLIVNYDLAGNTQKVGEMRSYNSARFLYINKRLTIPIVFGGSIVESDKSYVLSASDSGFSNLKVDDDGIVRKAYFISGINSEPFAAFSVKAIERYYGLTDSAILDIDTHGYIKGINYYNGTLKTDSAGSSYINYSRSATFFNTVDAEDLLNNRPHHANLRDKIVITDVNIFNSYDTPIGSMSHAEIQATIIDNIIHNSFLHKNKYLDICVPLLIAWALWMIGPLMQTSRSRKLIMIMGGLIAYIVISLLLYRFANIILNDVYCSILLLMSLWCKSTLGALFSIRQLT